MGFALQFFIFAILTITIAYLLFFRVFFSIAKIVRKMFKNIKEEAERNE